MGSRGHAPLGMLASAGCLASVAAFAAGAQDAQVPGAPRLMAVADRRTAPPARPPLNELTTAGDGAERDGHQDPPHRPHARHPIDASVKGSLTRISPDGVPAGPFVFDRMRSPQGIAIDSGGDVWVASLVESIGAAAPVATRLIGPPRAPR